MTREAKPWRYRGEPVDLIVDVRSKLEFWTGHLPGAVCIPVDRMPDAIQARAEVSPSSRILVYCSAGNRSAVAAEKLRRAGYEHVVDAGALKDAVSHFAH